MNTCSGMVLGAHLRICFGNMREGQSLSIPSAVDIARDVATFSDEAASVESRKW